jgi:O-antigen ligase
MVLERWACVTKISKSEVSYRDEGSMVNGQFRGNAPFDINAFHPFGPGPVNIGQKVGLLCLNLFIFFSFSRILDLTLSSLRLPMIFGFLTAAVLLFDGGFPRSLSSNITRSLMAFTVWASIGLPFSYWRTGTLNELKDTWLKTMLVCLAIAGLITTYKRMRTMLFTMASAFGMATLLLMVFGIYSGEDSRLCLPIGELANSNQVALAMMLGLPLSWLVVGDKTRMKVVRFAFALATPLMLRVILRTGSRAALIALMVMFLGLVLSVSFLSKVKLLVAGAAIFLIAFGILPNVLKARYSTLISDQVVFGDDVSYDVQASARLSAVSRKDLLKAGFIMTARNPIFGVGMGNFAAAANERSLAELRHMNWSVSHNSYLQLSSETGILGLLLYAMSMVFAWRATRFVTKRAQISPEWAELARIALCLRLGLLGLFVLMFFGSIAYESYYPCFAGLVVSLEWCTKQLLQTEAAAMAPVRQPAMGVKPRLARGHSQPLPV